jgi:hypothetical protein
VILVGYNSGVYLPGCLDALAQTLPAGCEVILLDNASSDGSPEMVAARYPTVRLVRSHQNLGYAAGNNRAAEIARGEYLVFLNVDTVTTPGWLEALIAPLESDPKAGLTTAQVLLMRTPEIINTCGNDIHLSGLTLCRAAGHPRRSPSQVEPVPAVSGAACAIRRSLFEALGGFDESFFMYMEDTDLSWRARLAGYTCLHTPASQVYHDYVLRFRTNKILYQERNRGRMLLKNLRWGSLLVLIPSLLLAEAVSWGFILFRQRSQWRQKLQAYGAVLQDWPATMRRRAAAQALRRRSDRSLLREHNWQLEFEQTGPGLVPRLARIVFNPLFWLLKGLALLLIWW